MTQEEKQLLLKDLCARIPYGLKATTKSSCWAGVYDVEGYKNNRIYLDCPVYDEGDDEWLVESVVPYLRPMSSMTDDAFQELRSICPHSMINKTNDPGWIVGISGSDYGRISLVDEIGEFIDWLNAHHFDYRGLIPMGLALEAPEDMYKD